MITHKKLAVLDLDGTLIKGQSQKYLISYLYSRKIISTSYYFQIMLWFFLYKLHLTTNIKPILEFALSFIKNKTQKEIISLVDEFYAQVGEKVYYPKTIEFIKQLKTDGYDILILSSAVDIIVNEFSKHLGIEKSISTILEIQNGVYTSQIQGEIVYEDEKKNKLIEYCKKNDYLMSECAVYADHVSDLQLIESVGHGYFTNPDKKALRLAVKRNIDIIYL